MTAPRLAVTRKEAAAMFGVSESTIARAKNRGELRAKKTSRDPETGEGTGRELYILADLQAWFDSLADA